MSHPRRLLLRTLCLAAVPLLASAAAWAAAPRANARETVFDAGTVRRGGEVRHDFDILNGGDAPLEITEVKATCGCMVTRHASRIAPGGVGSVSVVMTTDDFTGPVAKAVTVFTNDAANPRLDLVLKANILTLVEVRPGYARFIVVQGEGAEPVSQELAAPQMEGFEVLAARSPFPFLDAEVRPPAEDGEGGWRVELTLGSDAPVGPLTDYVVVRTNHPEREEIRIPVSGFVRPPVAVAPAIFDFGQHDPAEPLPGLIEVRVLSSRPVQLGEVTTDVPGLQTEVETVEEGRSYNLRITLAPGAAKGKRTGVLTLQTDSRLQPVLEIPVTGTVL